MDPNRRADEIIIPWQAGLLGNLIPLGPAPPGTGPPIRFEPWRWPGRKHAFATPNALHFSIDMNEERYRLLLPGPDALFDGAALGLVLDRSPFWRSRLNAAARFLAHVGQALPGLRTLPLPRLSPERQERLATMLWALDLAAIGASEHDIASLALGTTTTGPAWPNDSDRAEIRRLLREARDLARGRYRRLLAPPWR